MSSLSANPSRTVVLRPHRAQKILILAVIGFVFAPCGFVAILMARRDLRDMEAGTMDREGLPMTRMARIIAIVAGIVWLFKWTAIIIAGTIVYFFFFQ